MSIQRSISVIAGFILLAQTTLHAIAPEVLDQAKKATALVKISENGSLKGYGSAFCIHASGLFVTNAHVAEGQVALELVLNPGEPSQRVVVAKPVRIDKEVDLAILQATQGRPFATLPLGKSEALMETTEVLALGFPFGAALAMDANGYPSISVNIGRITSLRKKAGELQLIQLDASLNPGNSGGPVLDSTGHVVGIVKSGIAGAGVNFAIPVKILSTVMLKSPMVSVMPATLAYEKRGDPQRIIVDVVTFEQPVPTYAVELTLKEDQHPMRVLRAPCAGGMCTFTAPLTTAVKGPSVMRLTATFSDGTTTTGTSPDRVLTVGSKSVKLAEVRKIEISGADQATVTTASGTLTGKVALGAVTLTVGGAEMRPNWSKAASIDITPVTTSAPSVTYSIKVTEKAQQIAVMDGTFAFTGAPQTSSASTPGGESPASAEAPVNLIPNPSFEQVGENKMPQVWRTRNYRGEATHTLDQPGHTGAQCAKIESATGADTSFFVDIPVTPSTNYTLSAWIKTKDVKGALGGVLTLDHTYTQTPAVTGTTDWKHVEVTFNTGPSSMISINVLFGGFGTSTGTAWYDDIALFKTPGQVATGPQNSPPPNTHTPPRNPDFPNATPPAPPDTHVALPAPGQPYTSIAQMFETLPAQLQPSGQKWMVGRTVSPELSHRLKNQPASLTGEFASAEVKGKFLEVTLDAGYVDYRGFRLVGEVFCRFPANSTLFKNSRIHDRMTVTGTIDGCVVRGNDINKVFLWLNDPRLQ